MKTFRFIPMGLSSRLMTLLIIGLLIIQTGTFYWLLYIRFQEIFRAATWESARLVVMAYDFLSDLTPKERNAFMPRLSNITHSFAIKNDPGFATAADVYSTMFHDKLHTLSLAMIYGPELDFRDPVPPDLKGPATRARVDHFSVNWGLQFEKMFRYNSAGHRFIGKAAIAFENGTWLTAEFVSVRLLSSSILGFAVALIAQFLLQVLLAYFAIRYLTSPLRQLSLAADKLSPDDPKCPSLPRKGPSEVLNAAKAFKAMHERIRTFVSERMNLLASLSHDLRSPVARLRVQIENEPQLEDRGLMLDALDDLQQLMEQTIDLARCGRNREPAVPLNIGSLVESVANDYIDAGKNVSLEGESRSCCLVQASAIRRCLENLIDNALRYGKRACVLLEDGPDFVRISIVDDGPGIPEEQFEAVFQPFYRLERSRNKATGGTGLGLSIAQGLARLHGSEITLANRPEGGLCVSFSLPVWKAIDAGSGNAEGRR